MTPAAQTSDPRSRQASVATEKSLPSWLLADDPRHSARPIDSVSVAALAYLALPNLIFLAGWLRWPFAAFFSLLLLWSARTAIDWRQVRWRCPYRAAPALLIVATAFAWCALGGAGHFLAAPIDWMVRDTVLGDLVFGEWPVAYAAKEGTYYILRSAIGYFLPAAVVAKALGVASADLALYLWTVLGTAIFLFSLPLPRRPGAGLALALLLVVSFSGMDLLGVLASQGEWPELPVRLEWWTRFSYSSLAAHLYWAPNHALPIWLASALFYRHWQHPAFPGFALLLLALLPIWTPFGLPALLPFIALAVLQFLAEPRRRPLPVVPLLVMILMVTLMARFLGMDVDGIGTAPPLAGATGTASETATRDHLLAYLAFVALEFGALALALWSRLRHSRGILLFATLTLLLLPLLSFGPSNDLLLRASLASLVMLLLLTLSVLRSAGRPTLDLGYPWLIVLILLIGAFTPFHEAARATMVPRWPPSYLQNLVEQQGGSFPPHYVARLDRPDMRLLLREPSLTPDRERRRTASSGGQRER
ncbi:MAG TPA: hypothetical protein PK752_18510 [Accumulibacter sp.]|uniref:hypothetical protein n=1 Tax=Accumulibacter sp. TaxID=2053492 RepID=UPI002BD5A69A|nr:hypothetical protein [Accumulibacter sp.]HRD90225.1 hypothetical protein [Accumulibacter sp.]